MVTPVVIALSFVAGLGTGWFAAMNYFKQWLPYGDRRRRKEHVNRS